MFSFSSICRKMRRRFFSHSVFTLIAVFSLSVALFIGCSMGGNNDPGPDPSPSPGPDNDLDSRLIGTWESEYYDSYTITDGYLSYGYGADSIEYAGIIKYVSTSGTAGVIIIEYDAEHKPTYYAGYDPVTYEPIGESLPLKGNFLGIYYKGLKSGDSVQMGGAYIDGGAEKATLNAAIDAFTIGNEGTYISYYGTYSWQE
jgi:hypothetical protein